MPEDAPYNTDLMLRIREQITSEPKTHDQSAWAARTECGTTYCIAGWAVVLSGQELDWDGADLATPFTADDRYIPQVARELLGLDPWSADRLFFCDSGTALHRLDQLIEAGKNGTRVPAYELL